jgi:hypothetical protein
MVPGDQVIVQAWRLSTLDWQCVVALRHRRRGKSGSVKLPGQHRKQRRPLLCTHAQRLTRERHVLRCGLRSIDGYAFFDLVTAKSSPHQADSLLPASGTIASFGRNAGNASRSGAEREDGSYQRAVNAFIAYLAARGLSPSLHRHRSITPRAAKKKNRLKR